MPSLKQNTAQGLFWGLLNNGAQQVLNLAFGIFLARALTQDDYGLVGMLVVFSLIASALQESGFISALNRKREATRVDYSAVFFFNVFVGLACYVVLFFSAPRIAAWFDEPLLVPLGRYIFLSFVLSAFGTAPRAWLFRNMYVKATTVVQFVALCTSGTVGVVMAYRGFAFWGIATQQLVYCFLTSAGAWVAVGLKEGMHPASTHEKHTLRAYFCSLKGMWSYSWCLLITTIFTHLNNNLFSLFFGRLYGRSTVGFYNQANKWTWMGQQVLTGMVWSVAQPVFARLSDETFERRQRVFRKMLRFTAFLSFPALFGLALIAPELIEITITKKWLASVPFMQCLCIGAAFSPIAALQSNYLVGEGHSGVFMRCTVAQCLAQMVLLFVLIPFGAAMMVRAYVALNILWLLVWHYYVHRSCRLRLRHALLDILPFVALSALAMLAAHFASALLEGLWSRILMKIFVAATTYILLLWTLKAQVLRESWEYLRKRR